MSVSLTLHWGDERYGMEALEAHPQAYPSVRSTPLHPSHLANSSSSPMAQMNNHVSRLDFMDTLFPPLHKPHETSSM